MGSIYMPATAFQRTIRQATAAGGVAMGQKILHFAKENELRKYSFGSLALEMEITPDIFPPSCIAPLIAESVRISPGEKAIDIGTGSGILAIIAAKMGGIVSATDTSIDAIRAAKRNAELNNVDVKFVSGAYFAGLGEKFDVIIANLPQEIVPASYLKAIGPKLSRTIDGGKMGNKRVLRFLELAKAHMHEGTRIYLPVYTATEYALTIRKVLSDYDARLLAFENISTKEFVECNQGFFHSLNRSGKTMIFRKGSKWLAHIYIFELMQKHGHGAGPEGKR